MLRLPNGKTWHGRKLVLSFALLVLSICLTACDQSISEQAEDSNIRFSLWISKDCFKEGDLLLIRATLTNKRSDTYVVELKDQPVFDLRISYNLSTSNIDPKPVIIH
jgi:hypothetical protein